VKSFCDRGDEISCLKKAGNFSTIYSYCLLKKSAPCGYIVSLFVCEAYIFEGYVAVCYVNMYVLNIDVYI